MGRRPDKASTASQGGPIREGSCGKLWILGAGHTNRWPSQRSKAKAHGAAKGPPRLATVAIRLAIRGKLSSEVRRLRSVIGVDCGVQIGFPVRSGACTTSAGSRI
jgi:hypothetical protein